MHYILCNSLLVWGTVVLCVIFINLCLCVFHRIMASSGVYDNLDVHHTEHAESTAADRVEGSTTKPTLPESEFGLGISDSPYRPQTWSGMGKLFQQETLSDAMLMADGQSVPCHKFLLAAASEYFYNRLVMDNDSINHNLLEIEGISFSALKVIVSYLYTGNINITAENARDMIPACKTLKLTSACQICEKFALEMVNPRNCVGFYKMAKTNDIEQLSAKALNMMVRDFTEVVSGREFLAMSENDVADYIQNKHLKIPNEDPVFGAVVSWVRHQPEERESSFNRLITHVHLRYCSPHYLIHNVSEEPLMNNVQNQKLLVAAFKHQSSANLYTHQQCPHSDNHQIAAPRKAYARTTTLMTIGGKSEPGHVTRTECWSLKEARWTVTDQCPMPVSVWCFSACVMKEGILVTGGYSDDKPVSQCWLLSTSTYQWSPLPDLNTARARHASVCVGGQPYVIAGKGDNEKLLSSVECLARFSVTWEILPDMPNELRHIMVASYGDSIYVFGALDVKDNPTQSVFVFGTNSRSWQTLADMPQKCKFGSAVVWNNRIYIVGGFGQSCMCYDPVLAQWSTLSQCRHEHADAPALVWKDRILVCGGRSRKAKRDNGDPGGTSVIEEYDPETDTWTVSQIELPQKLHLHFVLNIENCEQA